jgi:hypothetical protein
MQQTQLQLQCGQAEVPQPQQDGQQIQQQPVLADYWAKLGQGHKLADCGTSSLAPSCHVGNNLGSLSRVLHAERPSAGAAAASSTTHSSAGKSEEVVAVQPLKLASGLTAAPTVQVWLQQHKARQREQQQQLLPVQQNIRNQPRNQPLRSTADVVELLSSSDAEDDEASAASSEACR